MAETRSVAVTAGRVDLDRLSYRLVLGALGALALTIMIGPVLIVLIISFTADSAMRFPPSGFSLRWYEALFDASRSSQIHRAAWNTVEVGLWATAIGTLLALLAALALVRARSRAARAADTLFVTPLMLPQIAFAVAALVFFSLVGFEAATPSLVIGHVIVCVPLAFKTISASLSQLDPALLESSSSLGAGRFRTFRRITLPIVLPGIAAGAFLIFMASKDNVAVSLFLSDARTNMLPIRMWQMLEGALDVRVAAVSGILILATLVLMLAMERLVRISERMR
jgi:putative spermidine/putrescine transport system permease protein